MNERQQVTGCQTRFYVLEDVYISDDGWNGQVKSLYFQQLTRPRPLPFHYYNYNKNMFFKFF